MPFSDAWLDGNENAVFVEGDFLLQAWAELDLARAIVCRYNDKDGNFTGVILAGVTRENAELYDEIDEEHRTAFTVMVQQAGSLWANGELSEQIRQQNQRLGNLTDSYSRFVPFQFLKLLGRESIEEINAGDHVSLETSALNARRSGSGELAIRFGVGINSGPLMLGAIGGGNRLDSNVVGDTANLASRWKA